MLLKWNGKTILLQVAPTIVEIHPRKPLRSRQGFWKPELIFKKKLPTPYRVSQIAGKKGRQANPPQEEPLRRANYNGKCVDPRTEKSLN